LLDVGVDFVECGRLTGLLAGDILNGTDPATVPIIDVMDRLPRRLVVNQMVLSNLKDPWKLPEVVRREVDILVDEQGGVHKKKSK
jgi:hypothetical protein